VKYKIKYGKTNLDFSLIRKNRKTLAIHVYPDQQVEVVAPNDAKLELILQKVKKRASWIFKNKLEFSKFQPKQPTPKYQSGETFKYLGKQYRLKIVDSKNTEVQLKNGRLILKMPLINRSEENCKNLIVDWYKERGKIIFAERFQKCIKDTSKIGVTTIPNWKIKSMKKRWGSCNKNGLIHLNPELLAAPKSCIDYVIQHELCHLKVYNHSPRFYNLLSKVNPDWSKRRDYLNKNIEVRFV